MKKDPYSKKKSSPLLGVAVALVILGGPFGMTVLIVGAVIYLIVKLSREKQKEAQGPTGATVGELLHQLEQKKAARPLFERRTDSDRDFASVHAGHLCEQAAPEPIPYCPDYVLDGQIGLPREKRLEQVKTLLEAGLYTREQYEEKVRQIKSQY